MKKILFFLAGFSMIVSCSAGNPKQDSQKHNGENNQASIINLHSIVNNNNTAEFKVTSSLNEFIPSSESDVPVMNFNGIWVEIDKLVSEGTMVCVDLNVNNLDTNKEFVTENFLIEMKDRSTVIFLPEFILNGEVDNDMDQLSSFVLEGQRVCDKKYKDKVPKIKLSITIKDAAIKEQIVELN